MSGTIPEELGKKPQKKHVKTLSLCLLLPHFYFVKILLNMVVCANALLSVLSDEHQIKKVDTAFLFYDFIIVDNYKWNYLGFFGELFRPTPAYLHLNA